MTYNNIIKNTNIFILLTYPFLSLLYEFLNKKKKLNNLKQVGDLLFGILLLIGFFLFQIIIFIILVNVFNVVIDIIPFVSISNIIMIVLGLIFYPNLLGKIISPIYILISCLCYYFYDYGPLTMRLTGNPQDATLDEVNAEVEIIIRKLIRDIRTGRYVSRYHVSIRPNEPDSRNSINVDDIRKIVMYMLIEKGYPIEHVQRL